MAEHSQCPLCGKSLDESVPEGLCPACLLKQGLEDWPSADGDSQQPTESLQPDETAAATRIGPYRLVQQLGRGGMGEVWLAEQEQPVRRKVALKLIQWGMDTKAVIARFEAERQALALMEHPSIAKVFDAGANERGRPYFVMEHVKGVPITEHCDRYRLDMKQRLDLFMQVCDGVQHAHQKGVIHRDIKPGNVLVTIEGDRAVPKIIDFGVAKATAQRLTEKSVFTEMGQLIGTPEYMSPEQADLTAQDIDTRSDVYSLGVLLYELLAGARPFSSRELRKAGYDEIRRKIREDDPPKPSTRLGSLGDERTTDAAKARRTDPAALHRQLVGDLDWITMRALEKDRTRRYGSPNEFAADVRRHLENEPVVASPPSAAYRAKKFVRRHRTWVGFAAVLLLVLIAFAGTMTVQAQRIARERDRANAEAERANAEAERASQEATTATRTSEFMTRLFAIPDPGKERGETITAREILDRGAEQIEAGLRDEPVVGARLMATMGRSYSSLGLSDEALSLFDRALEQQEQHLDPEHPETATTLCDLSITHTWYGDKDRALDYAERCLAIRRNVLAPDDRDLAVALAYVAWELVEDDARVEEAEELAREALAVCRRDPSPTEWRCSEAAIILGHALAFRGDAADPKTIREARALATEAVEAYERARRHGDYWDPRSATLTEAALIYTQTGKVDEGLEVFRRSNRYLEQELGAEHALYANGLQGLGLTLRGLGRYEEALEPLERATRIFESQGYRGAAAWSGGQLRARGMHSAALLALGEAERVLPLLKEQLARFEPGSWGHTRYLLYVAYALELQGDHEQARDLYRRAIEAFDRDLRGKVGRNNPTPVRNIHALAVLVREAGRDADALRLFEIAAAHCWPSVLPTWLAYKDPFLRTRIHEDYAAQLRTLGHTEDAAEQASRAAELRSQALARVEALEAADAMQ